MLRETSTEAPEPQGAEAGEPEADRPTNGEAATKSTTPTTPLSSLTSSPASSARKSRNRWWSPASRNRCVEKEERYEHEQRPGLGDTIALLLNGNEDADVNRAPYTITYPVSGNDGPNVVTSLKLRSLPNSKGKRADDDAGDIVFPIPARNGERSFGDDEDTCEKEDKASEAIMVVGFVDYELLVGVESQPSLGARLIAINDVSVEVRDCTLPKLLGELQILCKESAVSKESHISLTFRNDRLSQEDIAFLNSNGPRHGNEKDNIDEGDEEQTKSFFARLRSTAKSVAEVASTIDAANESEIRKIAGEDTEKNPNREDGDINDNDCAKETVQFGSDDPSITVEEQTSSPRSSLFARIRPRTVIADASSSVLLESLMDDERAASRVDLQQPTLGDIDTTETTADSNYLPKSHTLCDSPNTQNGMRRAPSREVFEVLHSHQALEFHSGRIVFGTDGDGSQNHSVHDRSESLSGSLRSSILSSDSEIEHDVNDGEKIRRREIDPAPPKRPNMATLFATGTTKSSNLTKTLNSLAWRNRHSQEERYPVTLSAPSSLPVTFHVKQKQSGEIDGTFGTGATVWPSSIVLVRYLELQASKNSKFLEGKSIIDLGAGTCIASIACAILGARLVIATDGNDHCIELATSIVDLACSELKGMVTPTSNALSHCESHIGRSEVRVRKYWWGKDDLALLDELDQPYYDIILCSDVVLPKLYPIEPLVKAIAALSGPDTITYVSYEHRHYDEFDPRKRFRDLCEESGLEVNTIPHSEYNPLYCVDDIEIWTVCKATSTRLT